VEGHNGEMQDLLRDQTHAGQAATIDLVKEVLDLVGTYHNLRININIATTPTRQKMPPHYHTITAIHITIHSNSIRIHRHPQQVACSAGGSAGQMSHMSEPSVRLLLAAVNFLVDAVQGPCAANQVCQQGRTCVRRAVHALAMWVWAQGADGYVGL